MSITPEDLAGMSDEQLDALRRQVMDVRDLRVHNERSAAYRAAERKRAAVVVREEIRAYLIADGDPLALHEQLDKVVEEIKKEKEPKPDKPPKEPKEPKAEKGAGGGTGG